MTRRERIAQRFRANCARMPGSSDAYYSQRSPAIAGLGEHGHVGREGCGAVAVHNALRFIGKEQDLCTVLRDFETLRMPWFGARFGTKPHALGRYFRMHKIPFRKYNAPVEFKAALLSHPIGIVCTWNRRFYGMHFYCVRYAADEGRYYAANYAGSADGFVPFALSEISNLRFITGYILESMND